MSKPAANPPVLKKKCRTCPWAEGSPHADLRAVLLASGTARICHSTGPANAINYGRNKPKAPARLCRGARDAQLQYFASTGFLEAPTDEAWAKKWAALQKQKSCHKPQKKSRSRNA